MEPRNNGWVQVLVFEYPSPKRPIVVNTYWFETKDDAERSKRRARKKQKEFEAAGGKVIAHRVRPAIVLEGR